MRDGIRASAEWKVLSAEKDGFPSYEVWVGGREVYDYQQGYVGQLAGSGDVSVNQDY